MSELNEVTPEEQVVDIDAEVDVDPVVDIESTVEASPTTPNAIDNTLTQEGVAADAKATGDAIAAVFNGAKVNNKSFENKEVTLYAGDIAMSNEDGAQTVAAAVEAVGDRTAEDILFSSEGTDTTNGVVTEIWEAVANGCTNDEIDSIFDDWDEEEGEE